MKYKTVYFSSHSFYYVVFIACGNLAYGLKTCFVTNKYLEISHIPLCYRFHSYSYLGQKADIALFQLLTGTSCIISDMAIPVIVLVHLKRMCILPFSSRVSVKVCLVKFVNIVLFYFQILIALIVFVLLCWYWEKSAEIFN